MTEERRKVSKGKAYAYRLMESVSVKDFCAKGDGSTDDTTAIQNTIDAAVAANKPVYFPPGRYKIIGSGRLIVTSGPVILWGVPGQSILDFSDRLGFDSNEQTGGLVRIAGNEGESHSLMADMSIGDDQMTIDDTSNFSPGNLVLVQSDDTTQWPGDRTPQHWPRIGQLCEVLAVNSGTKLSLSEEAYSNYLQSDNARVKELNMIQFVHIQGLRFEGQGHSGNNTPGDIGLNLIYCREVTIRDCSFYNIDRMQLVLNACYNFLVDNCDFWHEEHHDEIPPPVQYAVRCANACAHGTIQNCRGTNGRHTFNTGHWGENANGINRFITVRGCHARNTWHAGFSTHNGAEFIVFDDCIAVSCRYGYNPRDRNMVVRDCVARDCDQGVYLSIRPRRIQIIGCNLIGCGNGITLLDASVDEGHLAERLEIIHNYIASSGSNGICLQDKDGTAYNRGLLIASNIIKDCQGIAKEAGIRISGKWNGLITGNVLTENDNYGIRIEDGVKRMTISNNHIDETGNDGILVCNSDCEKNIIMNNTILDYTNKAINDNGNRTIIIGNKSFTGGL